jgi:hypothetical protein
MYKNDDGVLVIGESGSDDATPSRIKIDATNRRNSGRLQRKNNAKFSGYFTGSRKSCIIKGRGSCLLNQKGISRRATMNSVGVVGVTRLWRL